MPEIKHNFTGGKMNKDLDERLVPNGEYRDAMNIQISTSEGSEVGTIQNILGNMLPNGQLANYLGLPGTTCVASIADEKNDSVYWLATEDYFGSAMEGNNPTIYPAPGGNFQGQSVWPNNINDIGGTPNTMLKTEEAFVVGGVSGQGAWLSKPRKDGIYKYSNQNNVEPVFIDDAGIVVTIWSASGTSGMQGVSHNDIVNQLNYGPTPPASATSGFITQGLGYGYSTATMYKHEIFDGEHIQVGDRVGGIGINPWTGEVQDFLENTKGGVYVTDKQPGATGAWTDSLGNTKHHVIITMSHSIYTSSYNHENGNVTNVSPPSGGWVLWLPLLITHLTFKRGALKFSPENLITGINIIDDMLFWTDNHSEPKKINIPSSIEGTNANGLVQTKLINKKRDIGVWSNIDVEEKHITVIKNPPKTPLLVETIDASTELSGVATWNFGVSIDPAEGMVEIGQFQTMEFAWIGAVNIPLFQNGDIIVLNPVSASSLPPYEWEIKVKILYETIIPNNATPFQHWVVEIINIFPSVAHGAIDYNWAEASQESKKFKNKFIRFSYRYKYIDGEYSSFAPFTDVIFTPGLFQYQPREAFNLGMENTIEKITLKNYGLNLPKDVIEIDILYKESNSPVIYLVDNIKIPSDNVGGIGNSFEVKPNLIKGALPGNQLLRVYDNVPRKALAQEITGNRIVYGNYLQNYNFDTIPKLIAGYESRTFCAGETSAFSSPGIIIPSYTFDVLGQGVNIIGTTTIPTLYIPAIDIPDKPFLNKSLKSIRNYTLGVSYLDKYGRQTPVFNDKNAFIDIPISESSNVNQLTVQPASNPPLWATHYKVFIKETSNEYYNLAMDRVYEAKDGNVWLSFPSSDRNKVDEETFLILKKGISELQYVDEENRYKIIAIENEAPKFIKTRYSLAAESISAPSDTFSDPAHPITPSASLIKIEQSNWDQSLLPLVDITPPLSVKFTITKPISGLVMSTDYYDVVDFHLDEDSTPYYNLKLAEGIKEEWVESTPNNMDASLTIKIYRNIVEDKPEYDGRFFAKIAEDSIITENITPQIALLQEEEMQAGATLPFFYLSDDNAPNVGAGNGTTTYGTSNQKIEWTSNIASMGGESNWFIDEAGYKGYYDKNFLQAHGIAGKAHPDGWADNQAWSDFGHSYDFNGPTNKADYDGQATAGFNNGIYTEGGKYYIDLSFTEVNPDLAKSSNHADWDLNYAVDGLTNSYIGGDYWNHYDNWDHNGSNDHLKYHKIGESTNPPHEDQLEIVQLLKKPGQQFTFSQDPDDTLYTILSVTEEFYVNHASVGDQNGLHYKFKYNYGARMGIYAFSYSQYTTSSMPGNIDDTAKDIADLGSTLGGSTNRRTTFKIEINELPGDNNTYDPTASGNADASSVNHIQFQQLALITNDNQLQSATPAMWETEPKDDIDLDIYYEADDTFPLQINNETNYSFAPIGTRVTHPNTTMIPTDTFVVGWDNNKVILNRTILDDDVPQFPGELTFHRENGSCVRATLIGLANINPAGGTDHSNYLLIDRDVSQKKTNLSWYNCYSFENGVESNRIRDDFNQITIGRGVKVSSTTTEPYAEERRKSGLIYSGIYNSNSGVNNLNQFIAAEKITKDINPIHGSIQKLHSQSTAEGDLVALCEDRVLRILANKDALYNADGNMQLTSTNNVLGKAIPYSGNFGISKNPESFASESYRGYFTDKVRGAVIRLSKDGLTPISDAGMKDWFKDNLKLSTKLIGSHDDKKDEYNITLIHPLDFSSGMPVDTSTTVSFKEDVKGWVSFKSFVPEDGLSCANDYYTFFNGKIHKHHIESTVLLPHPRNTFYGNYKSSSFNVMLNDIPGSIKSFTTLNYEGSQSKIDIPLDASGMTVNDGDFYNLKPHDGWHVESIETDQQKGSLKEFIKKEGKWFNYIRGKNVVTSPDNLIVMDDDGGSSFFSSLNFAIQGLGTFIGSPIIVSAVGCMCDAAMDCYGDGRPAANYDPTSTVQDLASCIQEIQGCMDPSADTYNPLANTTYWPLGNPTDCPTCGGCSWYGCTDNGLSANGAGYITDLDGDGLAAFNYDPIATSNNGTCVPITTGCTDPTMYNYDVAANTDDASCLPHVYGCREPSADNYNALANADDQSCYWTGCNDNSAINYTGWPMLLGTTISVINYDAGANNYLISNCIFCVDGCTDATAVNHYPAATCDDGSCSWDGCTDATATNFQPLATTDDGSCVFTAITGCLTTGANNYDCSMASIANWAAGDGPCTDGVTVNDAGVCEFVGCMDNGAFVIMGIGGGTYFNNTNFMTNATIDNGCIPTIVGCMDDGSNASYPGRPAGWYGSADNFDCLHDNTTLPCSDGVNTDGGTCLYASDGCMDDTANNYNINNTTDTTLPYPPGSCTYDVNGCQEPLACNYNPAANMSTGTVGVCTFVDCAGCMDSTAANYNEQTVSANGLCLSSFNPWGQIPCTIPCGDGTDATDQGTGCCTPAPVAGCMDDGSGIGLTANGGYSSANYQHQMACNYNPLATVDDGSCTYITSTSTHGLSQPVNGAYSAPYVNSIAGGCMGCIDSAAAYYDDTAYISWDEIIAPEGPISVNMCLAPQEGCMTDGAGFCNYNPGASLTDPTYSGGNIATADEGCVLPMNMTVTSDTWYDDPTQNTTYTTANANVGIYVSFDLTSMDSNMFIAGDSVIIDIIHTAITWGNATVTIPYANLDFTNPMGPYALIDNTNWPNGWPVYTDTGSSMTYTLMVRRLTGGGTLMNFACGATENGYTIAVDNCSNDPSAIVGCMDPTACNYDCNPANNAAGNYPGCTDGVTCGVGVTCIYPFAASWNANPPCGTGCYPAPCGTTGTYTGSTGLADCVAACGANYTGGGNP